VPQPELQVCTLGLQRCNVVVNHNRNKHGGQAAQGSQDQQWPTRAGQGAVLQNGHQI
jgi:hypothetical protein